MERIKTIAIVGAGSLGVMYGQQLVKKLGKSNVFFIADKKRIDAYQANGIYCNGERCDFRFLDQADPSQKADLILFTVKFTAIREAVHAARGFVGDNTILMSVLNGIESEAVIGSALGDEHLLYCVVHGMDATKQENNITYVNMGTMVFGDRDNRLTGDVRAAADLLERAEISYQIPEDIVHRMWSKLMFNAGVNQVAAVFDICYEDVQKEGPARQMVIDTMKEVQQIAAHERVFLTDGEVEEWLSILDSLRPDATPSLRQDILAGRQTEVELFSGTMRKLGEKHGVETPLNNYLYEAIKKMEAR